MSDDEPDTYPYPPEKHRPADQQTVDVKAATLLVESAITRGDLEAAERGIRVLERIVHRKRVLAAVPQAVRDLLDWVPADVAAAVPDAPPFVSEASLYDWLGKEDARSFRARLLEALVECGCDRDELLRLL